MPAIGNSDSTGTAGAAIIRLRLAAPTETFLHDERIPRLQLQQLHLQAVFLLLVGFARQQVPVGIGAGAPPRREFRVGVRARRAVGERRPLFQQLAQLPAVVGRGAFHQRLETGDQPFGRGRADVVVEQLPQRHRLHGPCPGDPACDRLALDAACVEPRGRVARADRSRMPATSAVARFGGAVICRRISAFRHGSVSLRSLNTTLSAHCGRRALI